MARIAKRALLAALALATPLALAQAARVNSVAATAAAEPAQAETAEVETAEAETAQAEAFEVREQANSGDAANGRDIAAPRKGIAVAAPKREGGTAPMFKEASESSEVLMEYYSGARLQVVGFAPGGGMAQVQCGVKGASIMGYMRVDELRYGAYAERVVPVSYMYVKLLKDAAVYSYPDAQAPQVGFIPADDGFEANSRNGDGWVQLGRPIPNMVAGIDMGATDGFVHLPPGTAMGSFETVMFWDVDPIEGELSVEEAYEQGIRLVLAHPDEVNTAYLPEEYLSDEALRKAPAMVSLAFDAYDSAAHWVVEFKNPEKNTSITVIMEPDGTLIEFSGGNG